MLLLYLEGNFIITTGVQNCLWYVQDVRECLPSIIILVVGLTIMVLFIPYAFASVIKQLQMEQEQEARRLANMTAMAANKSLESEVGGG